MNTPRTERDCWYDGLPLELANKTGNGGQQEKSANVEATLEEVLDKIAAATGSETK